MIFFSPDERVVVQIHIFWQEDKEFYTFRNKVLRLNDVFVRCVNIAFFTAIVELEAFSIVWLRQGCRPVGFHFQRHCRGKLVPELSR